jgi:FkbM family methyltransferase
MGANSLARRFSKTLLRPLLNDRTYQYVQALAKAWDIRTGEWSEPELDLLPLAIHPGESVLDIGANFGVYSYHLSRAVGATGKVYAFEPVPFTFATLKIVSKLLRFRNVELFEKGCSDRAGTIQFTVPVQPSGALMTGQAHISHRNDDQPGNESQARWKATTSIAGEVVALDQFLNRLSNLSLIKCDIEGAELSAFRGASRMIDENKPTVICEINPSFLHGFGISLDELLDFFVKRGYGIYFYEAHPTPTLRAVAASEITEDNYIFIHPARRGRFAKILATDIQNAYAVTGR